MPLSEALGGFLLIIFTRKVILTIWLQFLSNFPESTRSHSIYFICFSFFPVPVVYAQVWRVNGDGKELLPPAEQAKFYSGDCYIFQYSYPGDEKEEYLIGTWFGKQSVEVNP